MTLEEKIKKTSQNTAKIGLPGLQTIKKCYETIHHKAPIIVNYLSTAAGTVGGDIIAKQFTENPQVEPRDILFTAVAAIPYSYLAPKMIEWSTKIVDKLSEKWSKLEDKTIHTIINSGVVTALYFPVNMIYWNYLTIKNQAPLTWEDNKAGIVTLAITTIPYLVADYIAIKKLTQPETKKWLRPFYSAFEILWNTMFSGGNYLAKRT